MLPNLPTPAQFLAEAMPIHGTGATSMVGRADHRELRKVARNWNNRLRDPAPRCNLRAQRG